MMKTKVVLDVKDSYEVINIRTEYERKLGNVYSVGTTGHNNCMAAFEKLLMELVDEAFELGRKSTGQ